MRRIFLTALIIWVSDFATKQWALSALELAPKKILGSLLQLTLVKNSGGAFGLAAQFTLVYSMLSLAAVSTVIYFARTITSRGWQLTAGLLLGGVLGNFSDRLFRAPAFLRGEVIDWIQVPHWPVFNFADSAIVIAAGIAFVLSVRNIPPITPVR